MRTTVSHVHVGLSDFTVTLYGGKTFRVFPGQYIYCQESRKGYPTAQL